MKELVLVFLISRDKLNWEPLERDKIPEWLRREDYWDRLIAGEAIRNTLEDAERKGIHWYAASAVDRANVAEDAVLIPPRLIPRAKILVPPRLQ